MWDLSRRVHEAELMDTVGYPAPVLRRALAFLELTNRRFGGAAVILRKLETWSVGWDRKRPIRILDVGTGSGDIPLSIVRWARERGFELKVTALDSTASVSEIARELVRREPAIEVVLGDLFELACGEERFDYVIASLFLHHVRPDRAIEALRACDRLAVRGLIISDLRRTWPSLMAVTFISLLAGNFVVRHDGPLSVRRAFRVRELCDLAVSAGLPYVVARDEPWFRVSLAGEKRGGEDPDGR
jgi:2-polyprenyl-3-methyl-5-hydroxy-6-metoxy-1,4-benzoquinol methylase